MTEEQRWIVVGQLEEMLREAKFTIAMMIKVAGGRVEIPHSLMEGMPADPAIYTWDSPTSDATVFSLDDS